MPISLSAQQISGPTDADLVALDLLHTADRLHAFLCAALRSRQWLDAYLCACGLLQLVEDRLHPDPLQLRRAADFVGGGGSLASQSVGRAAGAVAALGCVRRLRAATAVLLRARDGLGWLTVGLAGKVLGTGGPIGDPVRLLALAEWVVPVIPILGSDVVKLPACFRDFDQRPEDLRWLAEQVIADHNIAVDRRVCVVGVRTSGLYLAPLLIAALRDRGRLQVQMLTHRPCRPFLAHERFALRSCARAGGLVLICDDPPGTGSSLAASGRAVSRAGVADDSIALVFSLFGDALEAPPMLRRWPSTVQRWQDWAVHDRLTAEALRAGLASVLGQAWQIGDCGGVTVSTPPRSHVRARFEVRLIETSTGRREQRQVLAEGCGQGYLGRHPVVIARRLGNAVPRVYGFVDGLLFRDWLPSPHTTNPIDVAAPIVDYVADRQRLLRTDRDPTRAMRGRQPVWEVAAWRLNGLYGPLGPAARLLLLEPMTRRLLAAPVPSIVDGATHWRHWLADPDNPGGQCKVEFHRWAFSNRELACYDAVYDLAGAAADSPDPAFTAALRSRFQQVTGHHVDGERWLLYRLVQLWGMRNAGDLDSAVVRRRSAAAIHDYLAETYKFRSRQESGPVCAIDLDGVLESDPLGYAVSSPAGILALRALDAHGFCPVPVTGRSLGDVRDRCWAFGLAGGVAEYGSVIFRARDELVVDLRTEADRRLLERVRDGLRAADRRIEIDADYRYSVRARYDGGPLPAGVIGAIRVLADPGLRIVVGQCQTDIVAGAINKETGLRALRQRLSGQPHRMTVGDSVEDMPVITSASFARAPRNADAAVRRAGVPRTKHACQSGLAEACALLLGHPPGGCAVCSSPPFAPRTQMLLTALALREDGLRSLPRLTGRLAMLLARERLREHGLT